MKRVFVVLLFLGSALSGFSQNLLDTLAAQTCTCSQATLDTLTTSDPDEAVGNCLLLAAQPYKARIKSLYKINLDDASEADYTKFGEMVGVKMADVCLETLLLLVKKEEEFKKRKSGTH